MKALFLERKKDGIGINFKNIKFKNKETRDFIADSSLNRELFNVDDAIKDFDNRQFFTKYLISFAALDYNFKISI